MLGRSRFGVFVLTAAAAHAPPAGVYAAVRRDRPELGDGDAVFLPSTLEFDLESPGVVHGDYARWNYALSWRVPAVNATRAPPWGALCREAFAPP